MFKTITNVHEQLPFFTCVNNISNNECQSEISKYLYCNETKTPPYPGAYGSTPSLWVEKYYLIQEAIMIRKQQMQSKQKAKK